MTVDAHKSTLSLVTEKRGSKVRKTIKIHTDAEDQPRDKNGEFASSGGATPAGVSLSSRDVVSDLRSSFTPATFPHAWNVTVVEREGKPAVTWNDRTSGYAGRIEVDPSKYPGAAHIFAEMTKKIRSNAKKSKTNQRYHR